MVIHVEAVTTIIRLNSKLQYQIELDYSDTITCDYRDEYILVQGTRTITGAGVDAGAKVTDRNNNQVLFKNYTPFTDCMSQTNTTQVDNAKGLYAVMPVYNYSKNAVIIIQKHHEVYGNIANMNQMIMGQTVNLLNLNQNIQIMQILQLIVM